MTPTPLPEEIKKQIEEGAIKLYEGDPNKGMNGLITGAMRTGFESGGEFGYQLSEKQIAEKDARIKELELFVRDVATNWDCDNDGHKYNTGCRACNAQKLMNNL